MTLFLQLLAGTRHLHEVLQRFHGDIKGENVLVYDTGGTLQAKHIDLAGCSRADAESGAASICYTPLWCPPEQAILDVCLPPGEGTGWYIEDQLVAGELIPGNAPFLDQQEVAVLAPYLLPRWVGFSQQTAARGPVVTAAWDSWSLCTLLAHMLIPWLEQLEQQKVLLLQPHWEQQGFDRSSAARKAAAQVTLQRPKMMERLMANSLPGQGLALSPAMVSLLLRGLELDPKRRPTLGELEQLGTHALWQVAEQQAATRQAAKQEAMAELKRELKAQGTLLVSMEAAKKAQAIVNAAEARAARSEARLAAAHTEGAAAVAAAVAAQDQVKAQCRGRLMVARAEAAAAVAQAGCQIQRDLAAARAEATAAVAALAKVQAAAGAEVAAARAGTAAAVAAAVAELEATAEQKLAAAREEAAAAAVAAAAGREARVVEAAEGVRAQLGSPPTRETQGPQQPGRRLTAVRAHGDGMTLTATSSAIATATAIATTAAVDTSNPRGLRELVTMGEREDGADSKGDWRARAASMVPSTELLLREQLWGGRCSSAGEPCRVVAAAGAARGAGAVGWAIPVALESHGSQQYVGAGQLSWRRAVAAIGRVACEVDKLLQATKWG